MREIEHDETYLGGGLGENSVKNADEISE